MSELTKTDLLSVGAYWGPRKESVKDCAARFVRLLEELEATDPLLREWWWAGPTDDRATPEVDAVVPFVEAGRVFDDEGGPMADLGFSLMASNRRTDGGAFSLSATLGAWYEQGGNRMNLMWPRTLPADDLARVSDPAWLRRVLAPLIRAGEPTSAGTIARSLKARPDPAAPHVDAGWLLWLSVQPGAIPDLPEPTQAETFEGGTLLSTVPGQSIPHDPDPDLVELVRDRNQRLNDAGLLRSRG